MRDTVKCPHKIEMPGGTAELSIRNDMIAKFFLFPNQIVAFFRSDPEVIAVGSVALRWQAAVLPLLAFFVLTNMMLQASGQGIRSTITSSARNGLFFIPLILLLPRLFGLLGVEMTQAVADFFSFLLAVPFAFASLKRMSDAEEK